MKKKSSMMKAKGSLAAGKRYTCCVAGYFVPGLDESEIVRTTVAVVDLRQDLLVAHREFWAETDDLEVATEEAVSLAQRYGAALYVLSDGVPLEACPCGCADYRVRTITSRDLATMQHDLVNAGRNA